MNQTLFLSLALSSLHLAGCIVAIGFSPLGNEASAESSWDVVSVNRLTFPTLEESCDRGTVADVQLVFYNGSQAYPYTEFLFACKDGGFNTSPTRVLDYGDYDIEWQALDAEGTLLSGANRQRLIVDAGHIVIPGADFAIFQPRGREATFLATWSISGSGNLTENCAAKNIETVRMDIYDAEDDAVLPVEMGSAPCAKDDDGDGIGEYDPGQILSSTGNVLALGLYRVRYSFLDGNAAVVGKSDLFSLEVRTAGGDPYVYTLPLAEF